MFSRVKNWRKKKKIMKAKKTLDGVLKNRIDKSLINYRECTDIFAIREMYDTLTYLNENWTIITATEKELMEKNEHPEDFATD